MYTSGKRWSGGTKPILGTLEPTGSQQGQSADALMRERYLMSLRSDAPSQWTSSHLTESQRSRGAVYVALKVLMDQAASATLRCYHWDPDARMEGDTSARTPLPRDHPLSRLFHRPNNHESGSYLRRKIVQQLGLTGTSLLWRVNNGLRKPAELWSIPTGTYQPVPVSPEYPDGAYRIMPYWPGPLAMSPGTWNQGGVVVKANYIVAVRHPNPLVPNEGYSPLAACDLEMDTVESIGRMRLSQTRNGTYPSATVELDPEVKFPDGNELIRIRREIYQLLGGPDRTGKAAILSPGMKIVPYGSGSVELGWIESWNQLVGFVMSVFGVTKSLAFMSEDSSYAVLYAQLKQFNLFTLCPLLDMIVQQWQQDLITPFWGEEYCVELEPKKVDDEAQLEAALGNDLKAGIRTLNEIRKIRGLEKWDGPEGEQRVWAGAEKKGEEAGDAIGEQAEGDPNAGKPGSGKLPPAQSPVVQASKPKNTQGAGSLPPHIAPVAAGKHWSGAHLLNGQN